MSDFANLLGQFKKSANRASAEEGNSHRTGGSFDRKLSNESSTSSGTCKKQKFDRREEKQEDSCRTKLRISHRLPSDAGELSVKLSFLCIGAQKAGSTWLHEMLRRHPSLCLPEQKELHFWDWHRRRGLGWYSRQFDVSKKARESKVPSRDILCGEITPCYITLPETDIAEIKALFPDVKLIFIVRDLVERAWSALLMELRNAVRGVEVGKFGIDDGVDERQLQKFDEESDPARQSDAYFLERLEHSTHTERSDYATGLRRWLKYFSRDQLVVVDYGNISKAPKELLETICGHICTESRTLFESIGSKEMSMKVNAAKGSTSNQTIRPSLRRKMETYLRPFAHDFNLLLGELGYEMRLSEY